MENPSVVDSERHSASGSQTDTSQELNPEILALSENKDHSALVPLQEQSSPLGNDEEIQSRTMVFACQGNTKSSREAEPVSLSLGESPVEVRPPLSAERHHEDMVSHDSCFSDVALPISAPKGQSDIVDQNTACQVLSCEPEECGRSLESSPTLIAHPNGPNAAQNFLPIPRIVKHKQSSITFLGHSDADDHSFGNEGSENGEEQDSGQFHDADENDDNEDDVFNELPIRGELLVHNRSIHRKKRGAGSLKATTHCGCEAEEVCCSLFGLYTSFQNTLFRKTNTVMSHYPSSYVPRKATALLNMNSRVYKCSAVFLLYFYLLPVLSHWLTLLCCEIMHSWSKCVSEYTDFTLKLC